MGASAIMLGVRISAKVDYAVRAALELAANRDEGPVKAQVMADNQGIPLKFLENILQELRRAGIVDSIRGPHGGHELARAPGDVSVADIIRAIDGPLAGVAGRRPETVDYGGPAEPLQQVWIAVRAALRGVLEHVTLGDLVTGQLPAHVRELTADPDAWSRR